MKNTILIIEDDADIREGIRILLEGEDFSVEEASDGMEGIKKFSSRINLIILDIMMPGISGLKVCEEIRKKSYVPILFLTAKSKESDKLKGLMAGADDYLIKPFSPMELFARVKALLRRHQIYDKNEEASTANEEWIEREPVKVNAAQNRVILQDEEIKLTEIEYKILLLMMQRPTETFSIQNIYENVWKEPFMSPSANTIMVHIRNLRKKIEKNPQKPQIIKTVWGKGYRLG